MKKPDIQEIINATRFLLIVNYRLSLKEMIAAGKYNRINGYVTEQRFPLQPHLAGQIVKVPARLYCFAEEVTNDEARARMAPDGYWPATLPELFAFGAENPEFQKHFPIIAIPSCRQPETGKRFTAYLDADALGRGFQLDWFIHKWEKEFRFLGVKNQMPAI